LFFYKQQTAFAGQSLKRISGSHKFRFAHNSNFFERKYSLSSESLENSDHFMEKVAHQGERSGSFLLKAVSSGAIHKNLEKAALTSCCNNGLPTAF
jgi:hypothetical protein